VAAEASCLSIRSECARPKAVAALEPCPLLAQSGHALVRCTCPLLGVKRTYRFALHMSAFDPKRTFGEAIVIGLSGRMRTTLLSVAGNVTEYLMMPQPRRFDPMTPPPVGQRQCPKCGVPMLLTLVEPAEQADDDQRTFKCWSCSHSETIVVTFG